MPLGKLQCSLSYARSMRRAARCLCAGRPWCLRGSRRVTLTTCSSDLRCVCAAMVVVWAREPIGLEGLMQQYKYPTEQEMGRMGPSSETPAL